MPIKSPNCPLGLDLELWNGLVKVFNGAEEEEIFQSRICICIGASHITSDEISKQAEKRVCVCVCMCETENNEKEAEGDVSLSFSLFRSFSLETLSVTLPQLSLHSNTHSLCTHSVWVRLWCIKPEIEETQRQRGKTPSVPSRTHMNTSTRTRTPSHPPSLSLRSPTSRSCHPHHGRMIHSFDVLLQRAYLTAAVFLFYMLRC